MPYKKEKKAEYDKEYRRRYTVNFNAKYDAEIIEFLNRKGNKADYIKGLIKADMEKEKK